MPTEVRDGTRAPTRAGLPTPADGPPTGHGARTALERALRAASYEVLPLRGAEESVVEHVPRAVPLTVTVTEAKGLVPTLELAERLTGHGFTATPHLAARLVRDAAHLAEVVARLRAAGVSGVFVVGGDAAEPAGTFPDALSLLEALDTTGSRFETVGIGGYPEGHGHIDPELIDRALEQKAPHATHVTTQLCFSAATTVAWAREVSRRGVDLPIRVGLPGAVTRQRLVRISARLGLGRSARFLAKQQGVLGRFFLPHGYRPDRLVDGLAPTLGRPEHRVQGFHFFTFNEVARTEAWRQEWLARLSDAGTG
ncbi:methylenetetrahydrofolate reductase [Geodermatophilus marinus]|uniref:methylenetetrahydrofolate reductase n=1 Tax=Geodermatophilus sp. LHW52908 TaxID=2303986 RepID=UPI000E3D324F|nr:methylenetetrahydrofolate reductase [Geodermatophilus sp. LHW52908]RFU21937.1 5,10-methylenetetrahydrofolate reductase [Geodermatophilus sp. LHW52908]